MRAVGIRELKAELSRYLRLVRDGEQVLVTDRGQVIAEIRKPTVDPAFASYPKLVARAAQGKLRLARNDPASYPELTPSVPPGTAQKLLDEEREER